MPSCGYVRKACCLFENLTGKELPGVSGTGIPVDLFDPALYVVIDPKVRVRRDPKWRVNFNGLGNWAMCPTIRRTDAVDRWIASGILDRARDVFHDVDPGLIDRAMSWAYLNETKGSFSIERESPAPGKAEAFVRLLRQAWDAPPMTEDRLVALQAATITNPLFRAVQFRTEQNHLQSGAPGAIGVRYVPPPPEDVPSLMDGVISLANDTGSVNPIVRASLASFGFVYVHPFMDGNGRLSRFLIHYVLAQDRAIPEGGILPISAAMRRNEIEYLHTLETFSKPVRNLWDVTWIDGSQFEYAFRGDPAVYRYWDATDQTTFLFRMAEQSIQQDLVAETDFLRKFDVVFRKLSDKLDLQGKDLAALIQMCHQNGGSISNNRRKQYRLTVPEDAFPVIEDGVRSTFFREQESAPDTAVSKVDDDEEDEPSSDWTP